MSNGKSSAAAFKLQYGKYPNQKNSQPSGPLNSEQGAEQSISAILEEQASRGEELHWDSASHRASIALLAKRFGLPEDKRKAFREALATEPFDYASNIKKRLESAGVIRQAAKSGAEYK